MINANLFLLIFRVCSICYNYRVVLTTRARPLLRTHWRIIHPKCFVVYHSNKYWNISIFLMFWAVYKAHNFPYLRFLVCVGGPKIIFFCITFSGEYSVCLYIRPRQHNPSRFLSGVEWILLLKNHITKFYNKFSQFY